MSDAWFTDVHGQLMGSINSLLEEARCNAADVKDADRVNELLHQAEQQYAAAQAALRSFSEQRHTLLQTLDRLQAELAVAGRPIADEIS
ncbi:MAG TPA: hypothetical protein VFZ66_20805 [Herpetosiphonaceae bacterium]